MWGENHLSDNDLRVLYTDSDAVTKTMIQLKGILEEYNKKTQSLVIVCIGTDRSTGDALGPLVGANLTEKLPNANVFGTLENPVHAVNLKDTMQSIYDTYENPYIIAVDACLGKMSSVGYIHIDHGPIKPGAGVKKDLPPVGNIGICGVVNVGGYMEYMVLQNTRLSLVVSMAKVISDSIESALKEVPCKAVKKKKNIKDLFLYLKKMKVSSL
jgi:putative sporulation protein YyaC